LAGSPHEPGGPDDVAAELARIEAAVEAGDADLARLGFWGLVGRIKRDPALVDAHAAAVGRIDREAFERWVPFWVPVWFGNLLLLVGIAVGAAAILVAVGTSSEVVAGIALVFAGLDWSLAVHSPAHWVVGRLVGIRFTHYALAGSLPFVGRFLPAYPTAKVDYESYLRAPPLRRALMHAAGALATKLAPFLALAFYPVTEAPAWAAWVLVAYGALQILTDVAFSVRTSDWKRVRRELRVARDLRAGAAAR
jgi:hypothetical protein